MLTGIFKKADVAYGHLIIHCRRSVFRSFTAFHCHLIFVVVTVVFTGPVPSRPRRTTPGGHGDGVLLHCGYCTHKALRFCGVKKKRCDRAWALEGSTGDDKGLGLQHQGPGFFTEAETSGYSSPSVSLSFSIYKMNTVQHLPYKLLSRNRKHM